MMPNPVRGEQLKRGKAGPKCCGVWNQACRCSKPCTSVYRKAGRIPCSCAYCDCGKKEA